MKNKAGIFKDAKRLALANGWGTWPKDMNRAPATAAVQFCVSLSPPAYLNCKLSMVQGCVLLYTSKEHSTSYGWDMYVSCFQG